MRNFLFFVFAIVGVGLMSFTPPKKIKLDLDNPLNEKLLVCIDNDSFWVEANTVKKVVLNKGKHTFTTAYAKDFKTFHSGYFDTPNDGLLNITQSTYVVWKDIYMSVEKEEYYENITEVEVMIEGKKFYGDIILYGPTAMFIPKDWDYDIVTPFPQDVNLGNKEFVVVKKIFRKKEFIKEYYQANY